VNERSFDNEDLDEGREDVVLCRRMSEVEVSGYVSLYGEAKPSTEG